MEGTCRRRAWLRDFWRRYRLGWWRILGVRQRGRNFRGRSTVQGTAERMRRLIRRQIDSADRTQRAASGTIATKMRTRVASEARRLQLEAQEAGGLIRAERLQDPGRRLRTSPASFLRGDIRAHDPNRRLKPPPARPA